MTVRSLAPASCVWSSCWTSPTSCLHNLVVFEVPLENVPIQMTFPQVRHQWHRTGPPLTFSSNAAKTTTLKPTNKKRVKVHLSTSRDKSYNSSANKPHGPANHFQTRVQTNQLTKNRKSKPTPKIGWLKTSSIETKNKTNPKQTWCYKEIESICTRPCLPPVSVNVNVRVSVNLYTGIFTKPIKFFAVLLF